MKSSASFINPESKKHFSSEYRMRFALANPEFQENVKYIVPGEFAGKSTFKNDQLVNPVQPEFVISSSQRYNRGYNYTDVKNYGEDGNVTIGSYNE